ncbi:hypothetical protein MBSD_n0576 [Mizugakiibacter sediminis]|uniref:Uncharacterized protein n=1 Tax=Mizugakiibacter sediminis TaxID=1475481 RepID=A0A0K8QLI7_9GAMM|nr:hypothetical protein [Mizugakiibacter sediminis]GAP65287.1 hypothetical protein MBSD_n0576 [Mizugakiibacter sediminis]
MFARDPHARLIVLAGCAHIYEGDSPYMFGARTMAQHLEQLTGLDALRSIKRRCWISPSVRPNTPRTPPSRRR